MTKTVEIYLFVFILLVILFGVFLALKHPPAFAKSGAQETALTPAPHMVPAHAAPPKKKHHLIKTVAKTGLMVAPLALLAL